MSTRYLLHSLLTVILIVLPACSPIVSESSTPPSSVEQFSPSFTETSEQALIATEQAMAMAVKTEGALDSAAQPTFTPQPTQTSTLAHLPTLTPIPNSTPAQKGAFFDTSPDILGSGYEIENACYFDTQSGWERYEIYAGAVAGSGDEFSAQGAVVVRVFRVTEQDGNPKVELASAKEYLTLIKRGPLRLAPWGNCSADWMILTTPLNFAWFLHPLYEEFYQYEGAPPLARLESDKKTQIAQIGSYCWSGGCLDGPGISTSSSPLTIQSNSTISLYLPLEEAPDTLELHSMLVSPPGNLQYDYDVHGTRAEWSYEKEGRLLSELRELILRREQDIKIELEPGYYVLVVHAAWQDYGGVNYGFLIEVK